MFRFFLVCSANTAEQCLFAILEDTEFQNEQIFILLL